MRAEGGFSTWRRKTGWSRSRPLFQWRELLTYATTLNSLTAGRGSYAMEFARYDEVPRELAVRIIEAHKVENSCGGALIDSAAAEKSSRAERR